MARRRESRAPGRVTTTNAVGAASRPIAENAGAARAATEEATHQATLPRAFSASRARVLAYQAASVPRSAHMKLLAEYHATVSKATVEMLKKANAASAAVVDPSSRRASNPRRPRTSTKGRYEARVKPRGADVRRPWHACHVTVETISNSGARCSLNGRTTISRNGMTWRSATRVTSSE